MAAENERTNLSDFIRRKAVEAAEMDLIERRIVTIPAADWEKFEAWVDQPAKEAPALRDLATHSGRIIGYVSLSAGQIERAYRPKSAQRNRPDPVPIFLLGQLAIDRDFQGRGYSRSLLLFALTTAVRSSQDIGSFGVLTHPPDDAVRAFYRTMEAH